MDRAKTVACLIAVLTAGCSRPDRIIVGSKNFTEQDVLGEIIAQHIERRLHVPTERKPHIGGTLLAHEALTAGSIDLYPEYTGTALTAILKRPPVADPGTAFRDVAREYVARWRITWLPPLGFSNTFAMTVRGDTARRKRIATLSEAARAGSWILGAGYEFLERADGWKGLEKTYNLRLDGRPVSMDLGLLYKALTGGTVTMIAANSTDGLLSVLDVTVLRDDRMYFPPYQCAIAVRDEALARHSGLRTALSELGGTISEDKMREMNYRADGRHEPVSTIAAEFLNGLFAHK